MAILLVQWKQVLKFGGSRDSPIVIRYTDRELGSDY